MLTLRGWTYEQWVIACSMLHLAKADTSTWNKVFGDGVSGTSTTQTLQVHFRIGR